MQVVCVSLSHSPESKFTLLEMLCWSVSTATIPSVRRASTSATQAPSSRKAYTPGNDLTHCLWPLTSHSCEPDFNHGNVKVHPVVLSYPQTDVDMVDDWRPTESDDSCEHIRSFAGWNRKNTNTYQQVQEGNDLTLWRTSPPAAHVRHGKKIPEDHAGGLTRMRSKDKEHSRQTLQPEDWSSSDQLQMILLYVLLWKCVFTVCVCWQKKTPSSPLFSS